MTARRRRLGPGGPSLSQVAYGSMRLVDAPDRPAPADLLFELHDAGIDTHHSSSEYDSHPLYLNALETLVRSGRAVQHIAKLAEPSFDHMTFDRQRLLDAVDARLTELGAEQIAVLQWMCRTPDPADDRTRTALVHDQRAEMSASFDDLRRSGKIGQIAVFPYTDAFAAAIDHEVDVLPTCSYLSLFERQGLHLLDRDRPFIALRPFAGADPSVALSAEATAIEANPNRRFERALRFPMLLPNVATTVVSVNQREHIDLAVALASTVEPDPIEFEQTCVALDLLHVEVA